MGLRRVFHNDEAPAPRNLQNRVHVGRLAVQVDRDDGPGALCNRPLERGRVHRERARLDVDEPHIGAGLPNGLDGGDEGERHGDHLVAGADPGGGQRDQEGAGARVDAHGARCPAVPRELVLERLHLRAGCIASAPQHAQRGRFHLVANALVLRLQVDQRNQGCLSGSMRRFGAGCWRALPTRLQPLYLRPRRASRPSPATRR